MPQRDDDVVVVVPEEVIQRWQWPARLACAFTGLALVGFVAIILLVQFRRRRMISRDETPHDR